MPFSKSFPMTQDWNDSRYRASYAQFNLLGHNGQDFGCPVGTPILAPHDGRVIEALNDSTGYGWYVKIENDKEGSILAHFKESPSVKVGDSVKQGQVVGSSGNSGNSTGPHLHWGYYRFPRKRDNGFSGTVDQTHWFGVDDKNYLDELVEMRASRDKWKKDYADLEIRFEKEGSSHTEHIENLQSTVAEQSNQIISMNGTIKSTNLENKRLLEASTALQLEFSKAIEKFDVDIKKLDEELTIERDQVQKLSEKITVLEDKIAKGLGGYSVRELIMAILRR